MVQLKKILLFVLMIAAIISCKKTVNFVETSSLNIVNASSGVTAAKVRTPNVTAIYYSQISNLNYGTNRVFTFPSGSSQITMNKSTDTTSKHFYSGVVTADAGEIYSLFIGGAAGEDIVLNKDIIPYHADSSLGVRFVNMSSNSTPVNVTLSTSTSTNEFNSVAYKSVTDFKTYGATSVNPASYTFQARDGSGNLFASVAVSRTTYVWYNVTLVFSGQIGGTGTNAPKLFIVKNY